MKQIRKLLCAAVSLAALLALCACGGFGGSSPDSVNSAAQSEYIGTWELTRVGTGGLSVSPSAVLGGEMSVELKDNGMVHAEIPSILADSLGTENAAGTWVETDDGVSVTIDRLDIELTEEDSNLVWTYNLNGTEIDMTFEKQSGEES